MHLRQSSQRDALAAEPGNGTGPPARYRVAGLGLVLLALLAMSGCASTAPRPQGDQAKAATPSKPKQKVGFSLHYLKVPSSQRRGWENPPESEIAAYWAATEIDKEAEFIHLEQPDPALWETYGLTRYVRFFAVSQQNGHVWLFAYPGSTSASKGMQRAAFDEAHFRIGKAPLGTVGSNEFLQEDWPKKVANSIVAAFRSGRDRVLSDAPDAKIGYYDINRFTTPVGSSSGERRSESERRLLRSTLGGKFLVCLASTEGEPPSQSVTQIAQKASTQLLRYLDENEEPARASQTIWFLPSGASVSHWFAFWNRRITRRNGGYSWRLLDNNVYFHDNFECSVTPLEGERIQIRASGVNSKDGVSTSQVLEGVVAADGSFSGTLEATVGDKTSRQSLVGTVVAPAEATR